MAFHTKGGNISLRMELKKAGDKESFLFVCVCVCTVDRVLSINSLRDSFTLKSICIVLGCV